VAVNAKYIHSNPAIYSLRAYVGERLRPHVELAEYTINQYMQEILADIYNRKPDVIGFSCYIWNWKLIQELLAEIPKLLPATELWLGGPEVSYDADVILRQYPQLAGIMVGEGEATFRELLEYYVGRQQRDTAGEQPCDAAGNPPEGELPVKLRENAFTLQQIHGLCLHSGFTPFRALTDMSSIPFLYDDLAPFENKIIYYETSRGCPYRCSYCLSSLDKAVRFRDIDIVKRELQFFLDNRVKQVKFLDRTFNCSHAHAMAIWQYIYEHDNGVTNFHFEISAHILREDEIALLNRFRPGLAQLEIGVQSVNPETLKAIRRTMDVDRLGEIVEAIRRGGNIHQHLDLIAGLPFEGYDSFRESFNRVYHMGPQQLQLGFLKVLKGSEIWERAEEYGIRYLTQPPYEVLYTKWLSYGDVLRLKRIEEMVEIYYNSAQFTHTIPFLERAFPDPFAMYEALADFYGKRGYFTSSPARAYRYHVLLAFALEYDPGRQEMYRELLTYDMYLRENVKTRPDFAPEISGFKDIIWGFYKKEEKERKLLPHYVGYGWKQLSKMTHLEPFFYPVWDIGRMLEEYGVYGRGSFGRYGQSSSGKGSGNSADGRTFVLFDYQKRNPLNYEAAVQCIGMGGKLF